MNPKKGGRKYTIKDNKDKDIYLQSMSMMDQAIGWIEMHSVPDARLDLDANQVKLACFFRYPFPN